MPVKLSVNASDKGYLSEVRHEVSGTVLWRIANLPLQTLQRLVADVSAALARLDERVVRSPVSRGWIERSHFADACASLWVDGELVNLEDLVLHDASRDVRAPSHELTITADVLKTRRRIAAQPAGWALSSPGLSSLCRADARVAADGPEGEGGVSVTDPADSAKSVNDRKPAKLG